MIRPAGLLILLLAGPALAAQAQGPDGSPPPGDPRLERALRLLDRGRGARAEKLLAELESERPELVPGIRLALARRANGGGERARARGLALEAIELAGDDEETRRLATAELAVALAGSGESGEELSALVERLRELLAGPEDDDVTDRVRVRLCRTRELLPEEHPSSLARPELPRGRRQYLPKADPERGLYTVKPERIVERAVDGEPAPGLGLKGSHRASFDAVIDTDGCFSSARATSTSAEAFVPLALGAVRGWVFRPARLNGDAVAMYYSATVRLGLGDPQNPE